MPTPKDVNVDYQVSIYNQIDSVIILCSGERAYPEQLPDEKIQSLHKRLLSAKVQKEGARSHELYEVQVQLLPLPST